MRFPSALLTFATCTLIAPAIAAQGLDPSSPVPDTTPPVITSAPTLVPNANPAAPLAARIYLQTDEPTNILLSFKDGERSWTLLAEPRFRRNHVVPVLGVRPGRAHSILVTAIDAAGNKGYHPTALSFQTPPLPAFFPDLNLVSSQPDRMEPGVTLMNVTASRYDDSFLLIVDERGEVLWYYQTPHYGGDAQRISTGNFLYLHGRYGAVEVDMFGDIVQEWHANRAHPEAAPPGATLVDANSFHHDIIEMPDYMEADFAVMSAELREYPDYPANEGDPDQTNTVGYVAGDVFVEFKRDGTVVRETRMLDVIDPYRIGWNSLQDFWNPVFGMTNTEDWTHGNSILYLPSDDTFLYSARHQDAVVKFRRSDLGIEWILGPHENWRAPWDAYMLSPLSRPFQWQYHQHAAEYTASGNVILFDNGNERSSTPQPGLPEPMRYSRAVEYRIDPVAMTVEQVWDYGGPNAPWYSPSLGDADELPLTGNVLVVDGDHDATGEIGPGYARLVEVTRDHPAEVVWELHVRDPSPIMPDAWSVYRADHLKGVYPHMWP